MGKEASVKRMGWLSVLMIVLAGMCWSVATAQFAWDPQEFMGIDEIRPGMTGYGKTVFEGTKVDKFDIEVIGVLKKIDFGFDMILIKVTSGPVIDRKLQTVSGMSGSPIYIEDRLIGAYAYGWEFQQEAIAGVTPIAAMMECSQPGSTAPQLIGSLVPRNRVLHIGKHMITRVEVVSNPSEARQLQAKADPTTMVLAPVATPVFVSGMSEKALPSLQKIFDRYNLRALPGAGPMDGPAPPLEAGSAAAVSLMEGDANMSAVGTVTYVKGDTVLVFGHPFLGVGKIDLPLSAAYVHGIISSSASSFKLASPLGEVGAVTSDRAFAVAGILGRKAEVLPATLYLNDPTRKFTRRYQANLMSDPNFTPALLYMWIIYNGAQQMGDLMGDEGTFVGRMLLNTDTLGSIDQTIAVCPQMSSTFFPFSEYYELADLLMKNPYEPVKLKEIFIDLKYTPERNVAVIEKVTPDRPIARPGDIVNLSVNIRPYGKPLETRTVSVKVPERATEPVMLVVVAGGTMAPFVKPLLSPEPTSEEGLKGVVRWLTNNPSNQSLLTVKILPSPSYGYRAHLLRDVPLPVLDLLRFAETGITPQTRSTGDSGENAREGQSGGFGGNVQPTAYMTIEDVPYSLGGGQIISIAIDTEERALQSRRGPFDFGMQLPVLSSSLNPGREAPEEGNGPPSGKDEIAMYSSLLTPQQRARFAMMQEMFKVPTAPVTRMTLPTLTGRTLGRAELLSRALLANPRAGEDAEIDAQPPGDGEKSEAGLKDAETDENGQAQEEDNPDADNAKEPGYGELKSLLTRKQMSWGLTGRRDFLRGKHLGTGVTSRGNLVLVPAVRSIYQTNKLIPWKIITTANGTYLSGWGSSNIVKFTAEGKSETFFPKVALTTPVEAVTALASDADGNLLIGTWPDQRVRLVDTTGTVKREWVLPGGSIWDLAVTKNGNRYAACDEGMVYLLRDQADVPLQVACTVPDKQVFVLSAAANGDLLMATSPRGKVYRLKAVDGQLNSVYEAQGAVTSLTTDAQGNVYVGTSPLCQVFRISPDGTQQEIMRGMGRGNRHVLSLQMVGDDLYAATGPAGGIYRISQPTSMEAEVTAVFAREDARTGGEVDSAGSPDGVGPESVMVNALTVNARGELLAAASTPGQVLKLENRTQGAFLSTVLQTPVVARWGHFDLHGNFGEGQTLVVDSRSGSTAVPDNTWSQWTEISSDWSELTSPPAPFVQFRVRMSGATSPSLAYARLFYQPSNQAPKIRLLQPRPGQYWSGMKSIRWEAMDPDGDTLVFNVSTSRNNGKTWSLMVRTPDAPQPEAAPKENTAEPADKKADESQTPKADAVAKPAKSGKEKVKGEKPGKPAKDQVEVSKVVDPVKGTSTDTKPTAETPKPEEKPAVKSRRSDSELAESTMPWDTKSTPDGLYLLKIEASDKYAKPTDPKSAVVISGAVMIDNTPPSIALDDKVYGWDGLKRIVLTDNLTALMGGKYRIEDGPWTALVAEDGMFNARQEAALLVTPTGDVALTKGEYKVELQAFDSAGNMLDRTITVLVGIQPPRPPASLDVPPVGEAKIGDINLTEHERRLAEILLRGLE